MAPVVPIAMVAVSAASSIAGGISGMNQAKAQANNMEQQATQAEQQALGYLQQAEIQKRNIDLNRKQTTFDLSNFREQVVNLEGTQNVEAAVSGVQTSGSILDVMALDSKNAEIDALTIKYKSDIQEQNYRDQETANKMVANQYLTSADQYRKNASIARKQGSLSLFTGFLGAGASVLSHGSEIKSAFSLGNSGCKVSIK